MCVSEYLCLHFKLHVLHTSHWLHILLLPLQLDYLDLYLIHWPSSLVPGPTPTPPLIDTYRAMEALVDKASTKAVQTILSGCRCVACWFAYHLHY